MGGTCQRIFVLGAACLMSAFCAAQTPPPRTAWTPQPVPEAGWLRRVAAQQGVLTNQPCRVCFIGDSLTEFWQHTGLASWESEFVPQRAVNLGLASDRTENILNRIQRLDFRRANPRLFVLLMGTNNLGMEPPDPPADVARAVQAAVTLLRAKLPAASVLVLTLPPSGQEAGGALRQRIQQTNTLLERTPWPDKVRLLSLYPALVDAQDQWRANLTLDGTHFSEAGYAHVAALLSPVVREMLQQ